MLKLFVNLDTGEIYDDPNNREQSRTYNNGCNLRDISPDENKILIEGAFWATPSEYRLYDIHDSSHGYIPHNPYEFREHDDDNKSINNDIEKYYEKYYMPYEDDDCKYKFIDNNTIGKYVNGKIIGTIAL